MISLISAVARNGVIGQSNNLVWHIAEDLRRFKSITTGHPVIMGRKTFESLGRPLPARINVVITRQENYQAGCAMVVHSLQEALALFNPGQETFVIGGGEIYTQSMPLADRLYLTEVDAEYEGDVFFPAWDPAQWDLIEEEYHPRGQEFPHPFTFLVYQRRK